ncbi:L,D-transpeptidase family protein [Serpentinicella sp. ANB-PHB4]|uniref:L,D-transpeptidase family protein n=1 Tax=Serpentinicella sp. ANB-PHB4 TaxID=3074076 RepID=UPI002860A11D|nr:L,D-transpeptidase family protein [Serpentinicella sp. ANB-PHB4]MDR5659491.1 L,D-transpeptidase family protein [Serpentinicella sp. ANB-PHB4]
MIVGAKTKVILVMCIVFICTFLVLQKTTQLTLSRHFNFESNRFGEYYYEYKEWENQMITENPEYEDVKIIVDIAVNKLYLLNGNELLKSYPVASGKLKTPSPIGSWKIVSKSKWGGGFGTRWMGLNVPWGKFGIHGTNRPTSIGQNASAGCIRMNNNDVEDLYKYVKHGTPVAIIHGFQGPFGYGLREIKPGDIGADVMEIQRRLKAWGYYELDHLDGKYGPHMEQALYKFQSDNEIPQNPRIDWQTYQALGVIIMD